MSNMFKPAVQAGRVIERAANGDLVSRPASPNTAGDIGFQKASAQYSTIDYATPADRALALRAKNEGHIVVTTSGGGSAWTLYGDKPEEATVRASRHNSPAIMAYIASGHLHVVNSNTKQFINKGQIMTVDGAAYGYLFDVPLHDIGSGGRVAPQGHGFPGVTYNGTAAPNSVGGNEQCQSALWPNSYYDGDGCTGSSGGGGVCQGGTCVEPIKTGLTSNADGQPCNTNGVVGIWQGGVCVAGIQSGTCKDVYGNVGHYDSNNICLTLTGNAGDPCVGPGGIGGVFDAGGNCISCGQYQQVDANGQCADAPCPACMGRFNPGDDCVPITGATPDAQNPGCDAGQTYDPNVPGDSHCCWDCGTNGSVFDTAKHTCVCPLTKPNWDGSKCVASGGTATPPPPPPPPVKCPAGTVPYANAPGGAPCTPVTPTPPASKTTTGGGGNGLLIGLAVLGTLGAGALLLSNNKSKGKGKKKSRRAHA